MTYQGYEFSIYISSETANAESCIVDRVTFEKLCIKASNITFGSSWVIINLELKSYMGDLLISSLFVIYSGNKKYKMGNKIKATGFQLFTGCIFMLVKNDDGIIFDSIFIIGMLFVALSVIQLSNIIKVLLKGSA